MTAREEQTTTEADTRERRGLTLGKYRLIARLGTGGMADVYLAVSQDALSVSRLVVVKRLRDEQAAEAASREMFLNEARLAARLGHPNVIQVFEAGTEGGSYYIAMEYVDGQPLSRILAKLKTEDRTLTPKLAARVCADVLRGLHHAHELTDFDGTALGIVHRDVSPQNIMLTYDGWVKLVDFGIAKARGSSQTAHGVFKGKVAFMAPEQVDGGKVDRRADIFAMGICLWEAVVGEPLMADASPAKTLNNVMNKAIPRANEIQPSVPDALCDVIAKALARDPAERYATARDMQQALERFIADEGGVTLDDVAAEVTALYGDMRAKIQAQVKSRVASLSLSRTTSHDASHTEVRASGPRLIDVSESAGPESDAVRASSLRVVTASGEVPTQAPRSKARSVAVALWVTLSIAALGMSTVALLRSERNPPADVPPTMQAAVMAAPTTAAGPETPAASTAPGPAPTDEQPSAENDARGRTSHRAP